MQSRVDEVGELESQVEGVRLRVGRLEVEGDLGQVGRQVGEVAEDLRYHGVGIGPQHPAFTDEGGNETILNTGGASHHTSSWHHAAHSPR